MILFSHVVTTEDDKTIFFSYNRRNISSPLANDPFLDSGSVGKDESIFNTILSDNLKYTCKIAGQLPCEKGHSRCYNISEICNYKLNELGKLIPCRDGTHLLNCAKFECNMKFKCSVYYCIPWKYVCDGKWDCPWGSDENESHECGSKRICWNMYKCRDSQVCIHVGDICYGQEDCQEGDD